MLSDWYRERRVWSSTVCLKKVRTKGMQLDEEITEF